MNFGERLKSLRKSQNLTQQQLAERLMVQKSIISYYESGERFPSFDVLIRIANEFHVTTDYLLEIERKRMLDVSTLSEDDIAVVMTVARALDQKNKTTKS